MENIALNNKGRLEKMLKKEWKIIRKTLSPMSEKNKYVLRSNEEIDRKLENIIDT